MPSLGQKSYITLYLIKKDKIHALDNPYPKTYDPDHHNDSQHQITHTFLILGCWFWHWTLVYKRNCILLKISVCLDKDKLFIFPRSFPRWEGRSYAMSCSSFSMRSEVPSEPLKLEVTPNFADKLHTPFWVMALFNINVMAFFYLSSVRLDFWHPWNVFCPMAGSQ